MKGFALRLVLKQRHKGTLKWPIDHFLLSSVWHYSLIKIDNRPAWGRFLKGGINYNRYNSYSRDKSAILGITIPGIKMGSRKHHPWNSYSRNKFATLGINLPAKGIPT